MKHGQRFGGKRSGKKPIRDIAKGFSLKAGHLEGETQSLGQMYEDLALIVEAHLSEASAVGDAYLVWLHTFTPDTDEPSDDHVEAGPDS